MIRYFNQSPLWKHLFVHGASIPPTTKERAICFNKNLAKGHIGMGLYSQNYNKADFIQLAQQSQLSTYDISRISATFEPMKLQQLTGYQRYEVALPILYVQSIYSKSPKYHEYLLDMALRNSIDTIDVHIFLNQKSPISSFEFFCQHIRQIKTPDYFVEHLEGILVNRAKELPYNVLVTCLENFQSRRYFADKLKLALRLKSIDENLKLGINFGTSQISQVHQILQSFKNNTHKVVSRCIQTPKDTQIMNSYLYQLLQLDLLQAGAFETNLEVYQLITSYRDMLPKRNVLVEKVSDEEKEIKRGLFQMEKRMKTAMESTLKERLQTSVREKLIQNIELATRFKMDQGKLQIMECKSNLVNELVQNPLLYLNCPSAFAKIIEYSLETKHAQTKALATFSRFLHQLDDVVSLATLAATFSNHNLNHDKILSHLRNLCSNKPIQLSLLDYVKNPKMFQGCDNVKVVVKDVMELVVCLITEKMEGDYSHLTQEDKESLGGLSRVMKLRDREGKYVDGRLQFSMGKESVVIKETPLLEGVFEMLSLSDGKARSLLALEQEEIYKEEDEMEMQLQLEQSEEN